MMNKMLRESFKGKGGVNASLMSFGGTGSHKYVVVRLIVSGGINFLIFT